MIYRGICESSAYPRGLKEIKDTMKTRLCSPLILVWHMCPPKPILCSYPASECLSLFASDGPRESGDYQKAYSGYNRFHRAQRANSFPSQGVGLKSQDSSRVACGLDLRTYTVQTTGASDARVYRQQSRYHAFPPSFVG